MHGKVLHTLNAVVTFNWNVFRRLWMFISLVEMEKKKFFSHLI